MGTRRAARAALLWGALAVVAGCDGGGDEPGPTGQQTLPGRDFGNLFFWKGTLAFTRQSAAFGATNQDLWIWPDPEPAPSLALEQIDWSPPVWWAELIVGSVLMTGSSGEQIYNLSARAATDLRFAVPGPPTSNSAALNYVTIRRDGGLVVAYGYHGSSPLVGDGATFSSLAPMVAKGMDFMGDDLAVLGGPGDDWTAPDQLYRVSLPSGEVTPLGAPPFDLLSSGANTSGSRCGSFSTAPCRLFRVIGCAADTPACAETGQPPCVVLYQRETPAGLLQPYAFDVASGQELALPGLAPSDFRVAPDGHRVAWMHSVIDDQSAGGVGPAETNLYVHDFCSGVDAQCPLAQPLRIAWRADSALLTADLNDQTLGLMTVPDGQCGRLAAAAPQGIYDHLFSPDGQHLAWHTLDRPGSDGVVGGNDVVWIGDADGSNPRMLAQGAIEFFSFSPDSQALFVTRYTGGQLSLGRVPIGGGPSDEQPLADVYDTAIRGNRRVLITDRWNDQDGSGTLELVDLASGQRQVIARAVTDFRTDGSVDGPARLVYAVRGRYASGQDGLWQTTLPAP